MKHISLLAVDDEPATLRYIEHCLKDIPFVKFVGGITDPVLARQILEGSSPPDIVLLDIEMRALNGLELAKIAMGKTLIVFATAHPHFALKSYDYNAVDYLLKPYSFEMLNRALLKCKHILDLVRPDLDNVNEALLIKDRRTYNQVNILRSEIFYIESQQNYHLLYKEDNSSLMHYTSLIKLIELLRPVVFLRIHKSFAVQKDKIKIIGIDFVELSNGVRVKLGRKYKSQFKI